MSTEESEPINGRISEALSNGLDKALNINQSFVREYVNRIRRSNPQASPAKIIKMLERQYLATVVATGAAAGGVAAVPVVGVPASLAVSVGELVSFLQASTLLVLGVAEIHGETVIDVEQRRLLVLAVLLGDSGSALIKEMAQRTGKHWGRRITESISMSTITKMNKVLGRYFITKYGTKQGIIVIGRIAPFGVGAGIGGIGNALMGRSVISGTRQAFGPPPQSWEQGSTNKNGPDPDKDEPDVDNTDDKDDVVDGSYIIVDDLSDKSETRGRTAADNEAASSSGNGWAPGPTDAPVA